MKTLIPSIEAVKLIAEIGLVDFILIHFRLDLLSLFLMDLSIEFINHTLSLIIDHHSSLDLGACADID